MGLTFSVIQLHSVLWYVIIIIYMYAQPSHRRGFCMNENFQAMVLCKYHYLSMPQPKCWFNLYLRVHYTLVFIQSSLPTHWGQDNLADILQTTFSKAFSWMKMYEYRLRFYLNVFLRVQEIVSQYWFRYWFDADQATSHYLNKWLVYCRKYASLGLNQK